MAEALDDLDQRLLRLLQQDARHSFRTLARLAKSTAPTVAARIRRMEDAGLILGYTVRLDPQAFADDVASVDVGPAKLQCHTCHGWTSKPLWANLGGVRHPFCCTTCRRAFQDRYATLSKDLKAAPGWTSRGQAQRRPYGGVGGVSR